MLANHTGIIDSGYRGSLIGAFRSFSNNEYIVDEGTRLLQICHPTLCPIFVIIVDESELSSTERNDGGFGSTGI
jgi:dUTP pyrophosphatase